MAFTVYILCFLTSALCAALLIRKYFRKGTRFLLWSALCFLFLALNNLTLFVDLSLTGPAVDLSFVRGLFSLAGVSVLLYGFVWEVRL